MDFIAVILLFSVIFLPDIPIFSGFNARPDDIVILIAFCYVLYKQILFDTFLTKVMFFILILMFISIGYNDRLLSLNSFEFYNKIIKGLVSYTVCLIYMQDAKNYQFINQFLIFSIIIVIILNLLQFINSPLLTYFFSYYNNISQLDAFERRALYSIPRLTGLMGNPNNNATLFAFFIGFLLSKFFTTHKKRFAFLLIGCVAIIILTQSRTIFMATGMILLITLSITSNKLLVILVTVTLIVLNMLDIQYLNLIFNVNNLSQTTSITGRVNEWTNLLTMIKQQPFWGYGGYKEYFYTTHSYPESEYVLAWFRYGIFYLLTYALMLIYLACKGIINILHKSPNGYLLFSVNLTMIIGSISNTPFNNPRIFILYMFMNAFATAGIIYEKIDNRPLS